MLLSVIVTEYNTKKHLEKCINSILNQTLKDIEIIVVDDNSTENHIKKYNLEKMNIKYIYCESHVGLGVARNIGLSESIGKYICFIDSDDWIDLNYLETAMTAMEYFNAQIGSMGIKREYDSLIEREYVKSYYDKLNMLDGKTAFNIMTRQYNFGIILSFSVTNKIYLRQYLIEQNLRFLPNVYYEDFSFNFVAVLNSEKNLTIPGTYYHYFKRPNSIIQSFGKKHIDDLYIVFKYISDYMTTNNKYDDLKNNYFSSFEHYFNLLIQQLFEYTQNEKERKKFLQYIFKKLKPLINFYDYFNYISAEKIRNHIQPHIKDTTLL
jgi:glycosyltransferase involved in cell wall biosynthesis